MREVILSGGLGRSLHCNLALALLGVRVLPPHCDVKVHLLFIYWASLADSKETCRRPVWTGQHPRSVPV